MAIQPLRNSKRESCESSQRFSAKNALKPPSVDEEVALGGDEVAVGEDLATAEQAAGGRALLEGGEQAEHGGGEQPDHRGDEEEEERAAELGLDARETRVAFGRTALRAAGTIFLGHR